MQEHGKLIVTGSGFHGKHMPAIVDKALEQFATLVFNNETEWNISNLLIHIDKSLYMNNSDAPSFLHRLEGNLNSSECCGIESFANLFRLSQQGIKVSDWTVVDYLYWQNSTMETYSINWTPGWFKLDFEHVLRYNLSQVAYQFSFLGNCFF